MQVHHSYSSSAAATSVSSSVELSPSSTPHCGVHSSSGSKAICFGSDVFKKNDDNNNDNNNKYDASMQTFCVDKFLLST